MQISYDQARSTHYNELLSQISFWHDFRPVPCLLCRQPACHIRSHRDYLRRWRKQSRLRQSQSYFCNVLNHGIHNEKANPFASHPIVMTDRLERLYHQFFTRWNYNFKGPERHLFPFSRYAVMLNGAPNDRALFLGLLSVLATQLAITRDGMPDEFALALQLEVVSAQRHALFKDGSASDARVATGLCILCNAVHTDKTEDIGTNLELLKVMLQQRGGIEYLGMDGVLADNFMYIDHLNAVMRNEFPKFTILEPYLSSPHAPQGNTTYQNLRSQGLLSEVSAWAATLFTVLVQIYETAARGDCHPSNRTYFAYLANVVEYQLAVANAQHNNTNTLDECLILGLILFNHTVFRNSRMLAPSISIFEQRFWRSFHFLRSENFFRDRQLDSLEYYLTCVGTITSLRRPSPFQTETIKVLAALRGLKTNTVRTFEQLCAIAEEYGWSGTVCSFLYANLWNQSSYHTVFKEEVEEGTDIDTRLHVKEEV